MRVAVMLFRDQVAPRFGATRHAAVITVEHGVETDRALLDLAGTFPEQIPDRLAEAGAEVLICGGIHPRFQARLAQLGLSVIGGVVGPVEQAISAFRAGELDPGPFRCHRPGWGGGRGRGGAGRGRRARGGRGGR
jgi:predicted Fe-Mo cluster-binding NifX family protein